MEYTVTSRDDRYAAILPANSYSNNPSYRSLRAKWNSRSYILKGGAYEYGNDWLAAQKVWILRHRDEKAQVLARLSIDSKPLHEQRSHIQQLKMLNRHGFTVYNRNKVDRDQLDDEVNENFCVLVCLRSADIQQTVEDLKVRAYAPLRWGRWTLDEGQVMPWCEP